MGKVTEASSDSDRPSFIDFAPLPYLVAISILVIGTLAWYAQLRFGAISVHGLVVAVLERAPLVFSLMLALAAGAGVRLVQNARRSQREVFERNQELAEANLRLQQEREQQMLSEERFRGLFSSNPYPMWILDTHTLRFLDVNEATVKCYGYSREELLGMTATDIRPPEEVSKFLHAIRETRPGYGRRGLWRHRRKDGSTFIAEITVFQFEKDGSNRELVLSQDVSKRVETEEALQESQAALQVLVNDAPIGICRTSLKEDRFLTFNKALRDMLGYAPDEMLSLKLSTQVYADPRERERIKELLHRYRTIQAYEGSLLRRNGEPVRVRAWGALKPDAAGELDIFDVYIEDLTEQSTLEQQVQRVQKLEAVGRLAGGIAHDFNNILVVIKLSTEILLGQVSAESSMSKPLLQISNAADRAAALTKQLLAFGRQQVLQTRIINVNTVVADISHLLRRIIGEDIHLVTQLHHSLRNTRLDSDQLGQVLMNLAVNARDAMPEGGRLQIETDNVELDDAYAVEHAPVQPGRYVMIAVSDTGCGIDQNLLPRIFDPFFTTKPVGKGTGLGLSIVYGIVKQSGGYIWVYSEPGCGTTFKLYFPVENGVAEMPAVHESLPHVSGRTVLVVEDEAVIRSKLRECLVQLGYKVMEAENGAVALQMCEQQGNIDVVLTDLVMPRLGGHELSKQLAARNYCVPVVFMSGYTEDNAARCEIVSKGNVFLQKPFSIADLCAALSRALLTSPRELAMK